VSDNNHKTPPLPENGLYPIRTVSAVTGVNSVTLRAWERRYGLLEPRRTPKGHRLYTRDQIDRIGQVVKLLDQGIAISQVKPLLEQLGEPRPQAQAEKPPGKDIWQSYRQQLLEAIAGFDRPALDRLFDQVLSQHPADIVIQRLSVPVLQTLGARWKTSPAGIAEEHFFHAYLRNQIGARFHHLRTEAQGPLLVAACVAGEIHETGLLLFCLTAVAQGFRFIYLGANLPFEQLPTVVRRSGADAVVLSAVARQRGGVLTRLLPELVESLDVPLFCGGPAAAAGAKQIANSGAIPLDLDMNQALETVRLTLGKTD